MTMLCNSLILRNFFLAFFTNYYIIYLMSNLCCFVAVEFPDDQNVKGYNFWYYCPIEGAEEGDRVLAPLGRHDRVQEGVIRLVRYAEEENAPYPMHSIKRIRSLKKADSDV